MGIKVKLDSSALNLLKDKLKELGRPLTKEESEVLGSKVVREMRKLMKSQTSPIDGSKYPPLKKNYAKWKKGQGARPVPNLVLTGEQHQALDYRVSGALRGRLEIGYFDKKNAEKERGHREGHNGQGIRPTIPEPKRGEKFVKSIQDLYISIVDKAISRIARRKK